MQALGLFVVSLFLIQIPCILWEAWVAKTVWWWYLVPAGAPALSMKLAVGICLTTAVVWYKTPTKEQEESGQLVRAAVAHTISPAVILFVAWIMLKMFW
jgi:hypothetical protein